jgi:PAS domain S-box-containing protein
MCPRALAAAVQASAPDAEREWCDLSPDMLAVASPEGYLTRVNAAWEATLGRTPDELMARPYLDFVHPADVAETRAHVRGLLASGQAPAAFENRCRAKDGGYRWLAWSSHASSDGSAIYFVVRDATPAREATRQRERLVGELRRREVMLSGVVENSMELISVKDLGGLYLLYNRAFAEAFDLHARGAVEGKRDGEVLLGRDDVWLDPGLAPTWRESDRRAVDGPVFVEEWSDHPKLGRRTYASSKFPLLDADGDVYATCSVSLETTHRKRALERHREAEERFRGAFESAPIGMGLAEPDGRWSRVNQALCDFTGYSRGQLLTMTVRDVAHPDHLGDEPPEALGRILAGEADGYQLEKRYRHADGSLRWGLVAVSVVRDAAGEPVRFIRQIQDITERRLADHRLATGRDRALADSRLKSDFLAKMSHEIRTPLNGVLGMADLLVEMELPGEQRRYVETIQTCGIALMSVIGNILDLSRIEAGKLELDDETFAVRELVESACALLGREASAKALELSTVIDEDVPTAVTGDRAHLNQILVNLLSNAVKFTPAGHVELRVAVQDARPGIARLRFDVCDTGIGFEPGASDDLFTPFAQADTSIAQQYGGTGLGLAISKQLVEAMGGEMAAHSTPGEGSCFWFSVPLVAADDPGAAGLEPGEATGSLVPGSSPAIACAPAPDSEARAHPRGTVLVAEDDRVSQLVAGRLLERRGFAVDVVSSGQAAVDLSASRDYAAIFMDCQLPQLDGYEAATEIRRGEGTQRHTTIVAMTANTLKGERERCLRAGMDDYLSKPLRSQALDEVLARILVDRPEGQGPSAAKLEPLVDSSFLREITQGDEALTARLVGLFFEHADAHVAELAQAVATGDATTVSVIGHTLKGSASTVGALRVAAVSARLCDAGRAGDLGGAPALHVELAAALEATRDILYPTSTEVV